MYTLQDESDQPFSCGRGHGVDCKARREKHLLQCCEISFATDYGVSWRRACVWGSRTLNASSRIKTSEVSEDFGSLCGLTPRARRLACGLGISGRRRMKTRWILVTLFATAFAPAAQAQPFRWEKGQVLSYRVKHDTTVTEVVAGSKQQYGSHLML